MAEVIKMPRLSDTMTEGKIVSWNKKVGDSVKPGDVLAEVETDKATMELESYQEGVLLHIGVDAGNAVIVDGVLAVIGKAGEDFQALLTEAPKDNAASVASTPTATPEPAAPQVQASSPIATTQNDSRVKASPLAKKIAEEKGINIQSLVGSGDGGRIVKRDLDQAQPQTSNGAAKTFVAAAPVGTEGYIDIPLTQMRKTIARRLSESMFSAPHFYLKMEINMDAAIEARNAINAVSPVKVSFNDMIIKASAAALRRHPDVNSSWMGDFIRQNQHIHIGSAVAMPDGLIVPVVRFADQKSLSDIAAETKMLYGKAKDKKLQPQEFSGNTFTISNLGMMDIEDFTAIINPPDSCILAVGRIKEVVVKKGDGFAVSNVMKVTLSCDHRSVDGAVGASFLQTLKGFIEQPVTMLV